MHKRLLLVLSGDLRDGFGQPANWLEQLADGQADLFEKIQGSFLAPAVRRRNCR
jgi:hypothetical protein